jgi:hypothetical protein
MLYFRESYRFPSFLPFDSMEKAQETERKAQMTAMKARVEEAGRLPRERAC